MVSFRVDNQNEYNIQIETSSGAVSSHTENGHRYVPLKHSTEYKVRLTNPTSTRCNVVLSIDQKTMGKWRINPYSSIVLERPSDSSRKFIFVKENSFEAGMGGVRSGSFSNGLIEAKFIPEREVVHEYSALRNSLGASACFSNDEIYRKNCRSEQTFSSGATVLGDTSHQTFGNAIQMVEDDSKSVTKKIRLVVENARPQYVPLGQDSTPPRINSFNPFQHQPTTRHSEGMYGSHHESEQMLGSRRSQEEHLFGASEYTRFGGQRYCEGN